MPILIRGVPLILLFFLWVWVILDVIATDRIVVRNLPKELWIFLVIVLPGVGSVAWLVLGRPERARFTPGGQSSRPQQRRILGPEDHPDFGGDERRLRAWEDELRRREEELRRREEDDGSS